MSNTKGEDTKYTKRIFEKAMETLKGKEIDNYALFCLGFKTGRNYQHKKERRKNIIEDK